jgi:hypothetical protein
LDKHRIKVHDYIYKGYFLSQFKKPITIGLWSHLNIEMTVKYIVNDPKIRRNNKELPKLEYALSGRMIVNIS